MIKSNPPNSTRFLHDVTLRGILAMCYLHFSRSNSLYREGSFFNVSPSFLVTSITCVVCIEVQCARSEIRSNQTKSIEANVAYCRQDAMGDGRCFLPYKTLRTRNRTKCFCH